MKRPVCITQLCKRYIVHLLIANKETVFFLTITENSCHFTLVSAHVVPNVIRRFWNLPSIYYSRNEAYNTDTK